MTAAYASIKYTNLTIPKHLTEMEGAGGIERTRINQMFEVVDDEITLYHFYNSTHPLHDETNRQISNCVKSAAKKACAQVCSIDVYDLGEKDEKLIKLATGKTREEIMNSPTPIVVLKSNCSFKTVSNTLLGNEDSLRSYISNQVRSQHVKTVNAFADKLKQNKNLNDCLVAYYLPVKEGGNDKEVIAEFEGDHIISLNFIRGETDNVLVITDENLAKTCRLEPNKFYAYFKPSYLNGFENLIDKDLNVEYLQAFEGICRDEFTLNHDYIASEEFMKAIEDNEMQFTEALVEENFDKAFDRTTDTQFILNPNFKSRLLSPHADLPQ